MRLQWTFLDFESPFLALLLKLRIFCVLLPLSLLIVPGLLLRRWAPLSCCLRFQKLQLPLPGLDLKPGIRSQPRSLLARLITWLLGFASLVLLSLAVIVLHVLGLLACGLRLFLRVVSSPPTGLLPWTCGRISTRGLSCHLSVLGLLMACHRVLGNQWVPTPPPPTHPPPHPHGGRDT